jgi:hypothetical protein
MRFYHRNGKHVILLGRIWLYFGGYYTANGYRLGFRVGDQSVCVGGKFPYVMVRYEGSY